MNLYRLADPAQNPYRNADTAPTAFTTNAHAALSADGKYLYRRIDDLVADSRPLPPVDPSVFGGIFEIGERAGSGQFGSVYRLINKFPVDEDRDLHTFMLKVSRQFVDLPPYLYRKRHADGTFLYVMHRARDDHLVVKIHDAVYDLRGSHRDNGRTHGDVNPGNLLNGGPLGVEPTTRQSLRRLADEFGWEPIALDMYRARLIDPDISCPIGEPKRVSNVLHEDPRCAVAGPMDDLIGLLNTVLITCNVDVRRVGGLGVDGTDVTVDVGAVADYEYECPEDAAVGIWLAICEAYESVRVSVMVQEHILDRVRSSAGAGRCLMSRVVTSHQIDFHAVWQVEEMLM
eukprot:TRINITY_DN18754_c0_g1_i1.p1 TRINITY_DN18754_c0_g1~~TRINITY_DN18754_c0_g1_i1.p1  ORF type:complete len:344 (+),score=66.09 TRINITY_DN18754_c0_g1_i1:133-1164(+)